MLCISSIPFNAVITLLLLCRSEMQQAPTRLRFALILEGYCRGCGANLKSLCRQVEALEKLTKLTDTLKMERDVVGFHLMFPYVSLTLCLLIMTIIVLSPFYYLIVLFYLVFDQYIYFKQIQKYTHYIIIIHVLYTTLAVLHWNRLIETFAS